MWDVDESQRNLKILAPDMIKHNVHRVVANIISRVGRFSGLPSGLDFESSTKPLWTIHANRLWLIRLLSSPSIHRARFYFNLLPRALAKTEHGVWPMSLERPNELLFVKTHGKDAFFETVGIRQPFEDFCRNVIAELFVGSETVNQNTHIIRSLEITAYRRDHIAKRNFKALNETGRHKPASFYLSKP